MNFEKVLGQGFQLRPLFDSGRNHPHLISVGASVVVIDLKDFDRNLLVSLTEVVGETPVLFVIDLSFEDDVLGLPQWSMVDFVRRDADGAEFRSRILRLIKNSEKKKNSFSGLQIDTEGMTAFAHSLPLDLTTKEFKILLYLIQDPSHRLKRSILIKMVWQNVIVSEKTLNTHLSNLRSKIQSSGVTIVIDREGMVELLEAKNGV